MDEIAHVQMWTAGKGVSAGFHNHVEQSFCEIHGCLVNGTGEGGMRWATVPDADFDPNEPDLKKTELIVVPDLHAHGPLWRTQKDGYPLIRVNDTVDYPWHGMSLSIQKDAYSLTRGLVRSVARRAMEAGQRTVFRCMGCVRVPVFRDVLFAEASHHRCSGSLHRH